MLPDKPMVDPVGADRALLDRAVGGWRGVIDSGLPTALFLVAYVASGQQLRPALVASIVAGVVIAAWRLLRRESMQQVLAGFVGVAVSAYVASRTGQAEDFFVLGIVINVVYGLVYLVSILVRWPLLGLVIGYLRGDATGWRADPRQYAAYVTASWIWVAMFALRLLVQVPLYLAGAVGLLGTAKLALGWPLFLLAAYLTYRVLHPVLSHHGQPAAAADEPGGLEPEPT